MKKYATDVPIAGYSVITTAKLVRGLTDLARSNYAQWIQTLETDLKAASEWNGHH